VSHERPDALLKSALEKIVYFEARVTQLANDLAQVNAERDRVRAELGQASQREIDLRRVVAELEVRSQRAHAEREDAATVADALRRERAELLGKILDASRLNGETSDFDLASFIAELRSEVILRRGQADVDASAPVLVSAPPLAEAPPSYITTQAQQLESQGRLTVSAAELTSLERASPFAGRTEETLFGFSVRELSAPDAAARVRAAERLTALGHPAAAPALATALHAETEASVKVALLTALSQLAKAEAVPVVLPQLASPFPDVRMTALKALLKLDPTQAGPHLAAAVKDPDAAVRRRASLLALSLRGSSALELGETAIRDPHPDVRSLAALVLGASGVESARTWLMQAMRDPEVRVRRSASQALSRLLGQDVSQLVDLDEAQRRREVRRLSQVPSNPVKAKLVAALPGAGVARAVAGSPARPMVAGPGEATGPHGVAFARASVTSVAESRAARSPRGSEARGIEHLGEVVGAQAPRDDREQPRSAPAAVQVDRALVSRFTSEHVRATHAVGDDVDAASDRDEHVHAEPESAEHPGAPAGVSAQVPRFEHDQAPSVARAPVRTVESRSTASGARSHLTTGSRVAVLEVAPAVDAALLDGVLTELRAAIRGQSLEALATSLHATVDGVRGACAELVSQRQVVRRGLKYFVA
jgi:HEAT repeat protein